MGAVNFNGTHPGLAESTAPTDLTLDPLKMLRMLQEQIIRSAADPSTRVMLGDPLMMSFDELNTDAVPFNKKGERVKSFHIMVSLDAAAKGGYTSYDYLEIRLPNATADVQLRGTNTTFVGYLRRSFVWGGFPGLEKYPEKRDDALLAALKEGLLPI